MNQKKDFNGEDYQQIELDALTDKEALESKELTIYKVELERIDKEVKDGDNKWKHTKLQLV